LLFIVFIFLEVRKTFKVLIPESPLLRLNLHEDTRAKKVLYSHITFDQLEVLKYEPIKSIEKPLEMSAATDLWKAEQKLTHLSPP